MQALTGLGLELAVSQLVVASVTRLPLCQLGLCGADGGCALTASGIGNLVDPPAPTQGGCGHSGNGCPTGRELLAFSSASDAEFDAVVGYFEDIIMEFQL